MTRVRSRAVCSAPCGLAATLVLLIAGCAGAAPTAVPTPAPASPPSAAVAASLVASPGAGAAGAPSTASPTPAPRPTIAMPTIRADYDVPAYADLVKMFDYDASAPLAYTVVGETKIDGGTLYDITFQGSGYPVSAKLTLPDRKGPFPAVLYAHGGGLGPEYWLGDMAAFAKEGYAGLAIQFNSGKSDTWVSFDPAKDVTSWVHAVNDLRRGIDLLASLPQVDGERVGFVGHSIGCYVGGILAGVDARIDAYALMSCGGYLTEELYDAKAGATAAEIRDYQDGMALLNPVEYVGHNAGAAFLLQASKRDEDGITPPQVEALFDALPRPKTLTWYDEGHQLGCAQKTFWTGCPASIPAYADHRAWLKQNL